MIEARRRYSMADSAHVAEEFFDAWTTKDFERARTLLKDDLHFEGPIDTFDDADSYLNSLRGLTQIVTGLEKLKVFAEVTMPASSTTSRPHRCRPLGPASGTT